MGLRLEPWLCTGCRGPGEKGLEGDWWSSSGGWRRGGCQRLTFTSSWWVSTVSASPIPNGQSSQELPSPLSHLTASLLGLHSTQIHPLDILASTYPSTVGYHWSSWVCRCYWLAPSGLPARRRTPGRWAVDGRGPALALHSPPGHLQLPGTTGHHNNQTTHWREAHL